MLLTTFVCFSQKEHLEPVRDFKQYKGGLKEYYDNVFLILHEGFNDKPYARYTAMPSFTEEYSFSVEEIENKKYIISNNLSESYWYSRERNKVKLETKKNEINNDLYLQIGELFQLLVEQSKKPKQDVRGVDGVIYYISAVDENGEIKTGKTWSPRDNSLLDRLVEICDKLYYFGKGHNISQSKLENRIKRLIQKLKK